MILSEEQKGCRKKSRGTADLLYIEKFVLKDRSGKKKEKFCDGLDSLLERRHVTPTVHGP